MVGGVEDSGDVGVAGKCGSFVGDVGTWEGGDFCGGAFGECGGEQTFGE